MTGNETLTQARDDFCAHVRASEQAMQSDDPSVTEADKHTKANDAQVAEWDKQGITFEVLAPLLEDDQAPAIRCAAATYLLHRHYSAEALPVLEALADDDDIGLVAEDADTVLLRWRKNPQ